MSRPPKRVLIRRVYFINNEKDCKFIAVGFHPYRSYEARVQIAVTRRTVVTLYIVCQLSLNTYQNCMTIMLNGQAYDCRRV